MKRVVSILIVSVLLFLSAPARAQSFPTGHRWNLPQAPDSADVAHYARRNPWRAGAEIVALNVGVWSFNRFLRRDPYAYINLNSIERNLRSGFMWDNDAMGTNMFLHPYHGGLYFNAARSNGHDFWESSLFAFLGSGMWELFMESAPPSSNDILATPFGGMALGEVTYRVSDLILDDRATGRERFGREALALLVSPMRGLTRLLTGDARRHRATSGRQFGTPLVGVQLSLGVRALELEDDILDKGTGLATELQLQYGDRFDTDRSSLPYDYFRIRACLNLQSGQPILGNVNILGRLAGVELKDTRRHYLSLGLYQHFDYFDSDTISSVSARTPYRFGTPASFGVGLMYRGKVGRQWQLDAYAHLNGVILGAALSDYYQVRKRNYNLGSGYSTKAGGSLSYKGDRVTLSTDYEVYHVFTWKGYARNVEWESIDPMRLGVQGDRSRAILHATDLRLDVRLRHRLFLTASLANYTRSTHYRYYPDVSSSTFEGRLMVTWRF